MSQTESYRTEQKRSKRGSARVSRALEVLYSKERNEIRNTQSGIHDGNEAVTSDEGSDTPREGRFEILSTLLCFHLQLCESFYPFGVGTSSTGLRLRTRFLLLDWLDVISNKSNDIRLDICPSPHINVKVSSSATVLLLKECESCRESKIDGIRDITNIHTHAKGNSGNDN